MRPDPLPELLAPFREHPDRAAILTDFDGTLSPIVERPEDARPLPGALDTLARLAARYARVAVISGRPGSFLLDQLGAVCDGVTVFGLYGLERVENGAVHPHPDADRWRAVAAAVADEAERAAPPGLIVERKGLSLTLHWRAAPATAVWAQEWAAAEAERSGLAIHPARMSVELVPPIPTDKGTAVAELASGLDAVCFLGDDIGDLPAFETLDRLRDKGVTTLKVVARSIEARPELLDTADVLVDGPEGALAVLHHLLAG